VAAARAGEASAAAAAREAEVAAARPCRICERSSRGPRLRCLGQPACAGAAERQVGVARQAALARAEVLAGDPARRAEARAAAATARALCAGAGGALVHQGAARLEALDARIAAADSQHVSTPRARLAPHAPASLPTRRVL
jgi:hypothetical protein